VNASLSFDAYSDSIIRELFLSLSLAWWVFSESSILGSDRAFLEAISSLKERKEKEEEKRQQKLK
jgi:hypothetical protein